MSYNDTISYVKLNTNKLTMGYLSQKKHQFRENLFLNVTSAVLAFFTILSLSNIGFDMAKDFFLTTGNAAQNLERFLQCLVEMQVKTRTIEKDGLSANEMLKDPTLTAALAEMKKIRDALDRIRIAFDEDAGKKLDAIRRLEDLEKKTASTISKMST